MCFFPLVGVVIGVVSLLCHYIAYYLGCNRTTEAVLLTIMPIIITGGIHLDGFMDTVDAISSWKSKEERLEILKDPHVGAFAVIYAIVYVLAMYGLYSTAIDHIYILKMTQVIYVYSRILSGIGAVSIKKAKKDGMLAKTAETAQKNVKYILYLEAVVCTAVVACFDYCLALLVLCVCVFGYEIYKKTMEKYFGGITGDTAGFYLQMTEIVMLLVIILNYFLFN
jgi:adenosylcobinamide-GDP ribazoletransferase